MLQKVWDENADLIGAATTSAARSNGPLPELLTDTMTFPTGTQALAYQPIR
jgi:hypothetical protein